MLTHLILANEGVLFKIEIVIEIVTEYRMNVVWCTV